MINKYNRIARSYYPLVKIVFGNKLLEIQKQLLKLKLPDQNMLILGGGNGEILPFLFENCPQLSIDYVEASSKMLEMAKANASPQQKVSFIHSDKIPQDKIYSNYYFPFVLDCFNENELKELIDQLKQQKHSHHLYIIDFYKAQSIKNKLVLKLSILFFQLTTKHRNSGLIDVFKYVDDQAYKELKTCYLSNKFIKASYFKLLSY